MHLEQKEEWFATWFDSPYYHVLYDHRNDSEAEDFLNLLVKTLDLVPGSHVLDLACGAGRHARVLAQHQLQVQGCDLSANSIQTAKAYEAENLQFFVHDMRQPLTDEYQTIFNLFTSFGYFDNLDDNLQVLRCIYNALATNGLLVLDFMNTAKIVQDLKPRQEIIKGNITFHIQRQVVNGRIVKTIAFEDQGKSYFFQEKVQALYVEQFQELFEKAGFQLEKVYGNYALEDFDTALSDRSIFICRKG